MERKKIGVLFSGGLDSTYLVWDNLERGNEVFSFYFEIKNNVDKSILEKNRISLLHKKFHEEFTDLIHPPKYIMTLEVTDVNTNLHLLQVPIWVLGLLFSQIKGLDEIQIGYVMNDDAISYMDDIKRVYNSYKPLSDSLIPIKFPLKKYKKEMIVNELPEKYRDLTITCEEPKIKGDHDANILEYDACGRCPACKRQINSGIYDKFSDTYKNIEITNSMNVLGKYGKIKNQKNEKGQHIVTISLPEEESPKQLKKPDQLQIPFNGEQKVKYEKE